jgi:hypothetical protein
MISNNSANSIRSPGSTALNVNAVDRLKDKQRKPACQSTQAAFNLFMQINTLLESITMVQ